LSRAEAVWSRDPESAVAARELLSQHAGGGRHFEGVDLAFALPIHRPEENEETVRFLRMRAEAHALVGFNVSGLIYNRPEKARQSFSLQIDYQQVVRKLVARFLEDRHGHVLLVPHVVTRTGSYESDLDACRHVCSALPSEMQERVQIAPACSDPREIKWYISQCDWFCGTRMHSTIAALSAGVPAASIAYSMKTRGVFETCGVQDEVFDPRVLNTEEVIDQAYQSWCRRDEIRDVLRANIPGVVQRSQDQLDEVLRSVQESRLSLRESCATTQGG